MRSNAKNQNDVGTPRVPVLDEQMCQLVPIAPARARLLLKRGMASAYHNKLGIFLMILQEEKEPNDQPLVLGIDPESELKGWSVVGKKCTVLDGGSEAPTWVKDDVKTRKEMRKGGRLSNCPRRPCRSANRARSELPSSTKSRGAMSIGLTGGAPVQHVQYGPTYIDGATKGKLSLHRPINGTRLAENARVEDLDLLSIMHWRTPPITTHKSGISAHAIETRR